MVKVQCKFCENSYTRSEFNLEDKHPCVKNMLELIKGLDIQLKEQDAANKAFTDKFKQSQIDMSVKQ